MITSQHNCDRFLYYSPRSVPTFTMAAKVDKVSCRKKSRVSSFYKNFDQRRRRPPPGLGAWKTLKNFALT